MNLYGISAQAYLKRAEDLLISGHCQDLFYCAFELRAGIEARIKEYLEVQRHISKQKKKGWQLAKLGRSIEGAFRLGDKIAEVTIMERDSHRPIAVLHYTPVKRALRDKGERLGNYLHAVSFEKKSEEKWWKNFRNLLEQTAVELREATEGVLLGPVLWHRSRREANLYISGFSDDEMRYLLERMGPQQEVRARVSYWPALPEGAKSRVFMPDEK